MSQFFENSIFWIDVDKVKPNPYQPRREFELSKLNDLADSIRMYGVLQPLVVTRQEREREGGGLYVEYELISGERRLRASKLAHLSQVPALIRSKEDSDREKLELAIIENLQREDLNVVDRAKAFQKLIDEFNFKHTEVAKKVGKSREYVSNTVRVLSIPPHMLDALSEGKITEGHTRPILMLVDRPEEQETLFKEIVYKKINVREAEAIARRIAYDRVRRKSTAYDPEVIEMEDKLKESFGTRVRIEKNNKDGGKITIDFFSNDDLKAIMDLVGSSSGVIKKDPNEMLNKHISMKSYRPEIEVGHGSQANVLGESNENLGDGKNDQEVSEDKEEIVKELNYDNNGDTIGGIKEDNVPDNTKQSDDDELYSVRNFSL